MCAWACGTRPAQQRFSRLPCTSSTARWESALRLNGEGRIVLRTSRFATHVFLRRQSRHFLKQSRFPQHPDKNGSERPVLLAVDQEFGKGAALLVGPELADPFGPLEVGEHQDVEEFGATGLGESVEACLQSQLEDVRIHGWEATRSNRHRL